MAKVTLVYKGKFTSIDGMTHLQDKTLAVEGEKVGVSFLPNDSPVVCQIWANTGEERISRGCLLSDVVHYQIES